MKRIFNLLFSGIILVLASLTHTFGQVLNGNQPEQDPCNALVFCGLTYTNPFSYSGEGAQSLTNTPCGSGESNSVWIKMTINTAGVVVFTITPNVITDDYDFAVLNGTNTTCSNLGSNNVIRCNFNNNIPVANNGVVGLSTSTNITSVQSGTTGSPYVAAINANAGDVYYIMINNAGNGFGQGNSSGFALDFTGSTATFNQGPLPYLDAVESPFCNNANYVKVTTTKQILCSSIASNASDFYITPNLANISSVIGTNCTNVNGYSTELTINFSNALPPGDYVLHSATGTDGNTLLDFCGQQMPVDDTLHFKVYKLKDTVTRTICSAQLPYTWNGITVTTAGLPAATYHTNSLLVSCDSTTYLNLIVIPAYNDTVNQAVCPNMMPYTWHNTVINSPGTNVATYHTQTAAGCDSNVHLNLSIIEPVQQVLNLSGCGSVTINPYYLTSDTNIIDTVQSIYGCDSLYRNITVVVHPVNPVKDSNTYQGCGNVVFNNTNYTSSVILKDTVLNQYGCDSVYRTNNIIVYPNIPDTLRIDTVGCDSLTFEGQYFTTDDSLTKTFTNTFGCDSLFRIVKIHIEKFRVNLTYSPEEPVVGVKVRLSTSANITPYSVYAWLPSNLFSNQTDTAQNIYVDSSRIYWVYARSANGCIDSDSVHMNVGPVIPEMNMPNAFSPNGDGVNDLFRPKFYIKSGYRVNSFKIYNRWGQLVYESQAAGYDADYGWNGTVENTGKPCPSGVYFYTIDAVFVNGEKRTFKGDVTLIR